MSILSVSILFYKTHSVTTTAAMAFLVFHKDIELSQDECAMQILSFPTCIMRMDLEASGLLKLRLGKGMDHEETDQETLRKKTKGLHHDKRWSPYLRKHLL